MNETYFPGVDVYQNNGKSKMAIAIFNAKTNRFVFVSKKNWIVRLWVMICRITRVRVMKEIPEYRW